MGVTESKEVEEPEAADLEQEEPEAIAPDQAGKTGGTNDMPGRAQRPQRTAAVWAQVCLEKYHKSCTFERSIADILTVPASVLFRRKHPAGDDHPTSWKCAHTAEAEDQMCPSHTTMLLFLPDSEELTYPDQDREQLEEDHHQQADGSLNFLPVSMLATTVAPMSYADDKSSGLLEYETSSEGRTMAKAMELPAVMDPSGTAGEEVPDGFCLLALKDFLVWDSWITWEQELRQAQHERDKLLAFLEMRLPPKLVMEEQFVKDSGFSPNPYSSHFLFCSIYSYLSFMHAFAVCQCLLCLL